MKRLAPAALALMIVCPSAMAEESGWLGAISGFVVDGLSPARTAEDIRRDEEKAREAALRETPPAPMPEPAAPAVKLAEPEPVAPPPPVIAAPAPAPVLPVAPAAPVVVAAPVPPAPVAVPAPMVSPAAAMPVPMPRPPTPKPVVVQAPPPPEPLTSHIAATATLDQARKLGEPVDGYFSRKKAVKN